MAKWIVRRGKVSKDGETYCVGEIVEMPVKAASVLPAGMVERVPDTAANPPEPAPIEEPEPEPEEPEEEEAKPERVTI